MIAAALWLELLIEIGALSAFTFRLPDSIVWWAWPALQLGVFVTLRGVLIAASCVFAQRRDRQREVLSAPAWLHLWCCETMALSRFNVLMLSADRYLVPAAPMGLPSTTTVVLLHGVYCNGGIWRPLRNYLHARRPDLRVIAPSLGPVRADIHSQAQRFAQWLDAVALSPTGRLVIVGHSMGGLIARICIAKRMTQRRVDMLICIGAPHRGSELACIVPGNLGRDLHPQSRVLQELNETAMQSPGTPVVNIYSCHDNLVVPADSAHLPSARNHVLHGVGHMTLVYSAAVWNTVLHELQVA